MRVPFLFYIETRTKPLAFRSPLAVFCLAVSPMPERAWAEVIESLLTGRTQPSRKNGLSMVVDKGLGPAATADLLEMCGGVIDHWKCAFGTSAFVPADALRRKLVSLAAHGILTYPGGTLLEVAIVVGSCRTFMRRAHSLGFSAVEISDGTIPLPSHRRHNVIRCALDHGLTPITEVGKKDATHQPTAVELAEQALQDLAWGAQWVTVEAREEGRGIGIYDDPVRAYSGLSSSGSVVVGYRPPLGRTLVPPARLAKHGEQSIHIPSRYVLVFLLP